MILRKILRYIKRRIAIARIRRMEAYLDEIQRALDRDTEALRSTSKAGADGDAALAAKIEALTDYYESGLWLKDYEADEAGMLPADLKRGVLAQDTLYDLLGEIARRRKNTEK